MPNLAVLALFLFSLLAVQEYIEHFYVLLVCFAVLVVVSIITKGGIGGGDIKLLSVLAFFMGNKFYELMFFMAIVMLMGFLGVFIKEKRLDVEVPLVPYIFLSYTFWMVVIVFSGGVSFPWNYSLHIWFSGGYIVQ